MERTRLIVGKALMSERTSVVRGYVASERT
jgi:hypothetical protein